MARKIKESPIMLGAFLGPEGSRAPQNVIHAPTHADTSAQLTNLSFFKYDRRNLCLPSTKLKCDKAKMNMPNPNSKKERGIKSFNC